MAVPQSLLQNLVANAQLQQRESLRARKMRELAQAAPRGQAARLGAPSPIVQRPDNSLGQGLSALGKALGDIGQMKKESAAKDAFAKMYEPTMVTDDMGGATAMPTTPKARALMDFAVRNAGTKTGASALQAAQLAMQAENQAATRENQLALKRMEMQQKNLPRARAAATLSRVSKPLGDMVANNEMEITTAGQIAANPAALKMFNAGDMAGALQAANVEIARTIEVEGDDGTKRIKGITKTGTQIDLGPAAKVPGRDKPYSTGVLGQKIDLAEATGRARGLIEMEMKNLDANQKNDKAMVAIHEASGILSSGVATGSVMGNTLDNLAEIIGFSTLGAQATSRLKLLQTIIMLEGKRMEGQQSDRDVILYEKAAANIGNANVPVETRQAALRTLARLMRKYRTQTGRGGERSTIINNEQPPMPEGFVRVGEEE